jgi:hypothetical protein
MSGDPNKRRRRSPGDRDQDYVIDLVDEALGEQGLREHRFDWLLGDPGRAGLRAFLPVDAYYPGRGLVVEYHEHQHDRPVPIMDRRPTLSGVPRGVQRRISDQRRREQVPAHGLRLVIIRATISMSMLAAGSADVTGMLIFRSCVACWPPRNDRPLALQASEPAAGPDSEKSRSRK